MKITHERKDKIISREVEDNISFLISDRKGGYFSQAAVWNKSFFQGSFSRLPDDEGWTLFKFIERIDIEDSNIVGIVKTDSKIIIRTEEGKLSIFFDEQGRINLENDTSKRIMINFDARKIYDFSDFEREYRFEDDNDGTIVTYYKKSNGGEDYTLFLGIKGYEKIEKKEEWIRRHYDFDASRSGNGERYVFGGVALSGKKIVIAQHYDKESLQKLLEKRSDGTEINEAALDENQMDDSTYIAYKCTVDSSSDLIVGEEGIYAGFYWFFHFWTRDESISLGGLEKEDEDIVDTVLERLFSQVLEDGRLPNRHPHSELGSSDGIGWASLRFAQHAEKMDDNKRDEIVSQMKKSCERLLEHHTEDSFDINGKKETWMDTTGTTEDFREGARIEMQALRLRMYDTLYQHTGEEKYKELMNELKEKMNKEFLEENMIADGIIKRGDSWEKDMTVRPNIFLAYYIFPEMFSSDVWKRSFDEALEKLWLSWGGLATIDKNHMWFKGYYTGDNDESYHRGDSWYFVNNIAAIAMHRLDRDRYDSYISGILEASKEDILWKGIIGGASEISSANEQRAEGTWQQAWSSCTLIELIHELYG